MNSLAFLEIRKTLDTEPRIFIRNDRWTFTDRSKMKWTGIKYRAGPNFEWNQTGT